MFTYSENNEFKMNKNESEQKDKECFLIFNYARLTIQAEDIEPSIQCESETRKDGKGFTSAYDLSIPSQTSSFHKFLEFIA